MDNVAMRKVKDLEPAARRWLQKLLGRKLQEAEEVTVMVSSAQSASPEAVRRKAFARLERIMDKAAQKAAHIPDREVEAAIDEAMAHVRRRKP
jgi:hypothetical protein